MAKKLKRKKKGNKSTIKTGNLINILKKVYLNGAIEECILNIRKGTGKITAVDITNSMIVMVSGKITGKKTSGEFGLGNIDLLSKFVSTIEDSDVPFKLTRNRLIISSKDSRRRLEYILTQPDLIATRFQQEDEDESPYEKILSLMEYRAEITNSFLKDFLKYIGMLKTKEVILNYDGDEVSILCGTSDDYRIELKSDSEVERIGKAKGKGFSIKVDGEYLSKIFSVIEPDEDDLPILSFAKDKPLMIQEHSESENVWVLVPLTDLEEEGYDEEDEDE